MTRFIDRHPKERPSAASQVNRRSFLGGSLAAAVGVTAGSSLLAACGGDSGGGGGAAPASGIPLARRDNPVTLPLFDDNPPVADGLQPETGGVLKILNYADYMAPGVIKLIEKKYDVKIEITPITNYDELVAKLRQPGADFDLVFPGPSRLSKLAYAKLLQPFNQTYLPNMANLWDNYQSPFYDVGSLYSVPYTVYTSGVGYRADRVDAIPDNGWDLVYDTQYAGKVYILDDNRESIGMALLRNGITDDLNTEDPEQVNAGADSLKTLIDSVNVKVGIQAYTAIPEGTATIYHTWSGDMVGARWYLPKGQSVKVLGYWKSDNPPIGNDCMSVGAGASKPVLAHAVINDILDNEISLKNFGWNGYQPPITALDTNKLVSEGYVPENLTTTIVLPEDFDNGLEELELTPQGEVLWQTAWAGFRSGA
jgi:spermidine/putrescine transport system substrate-binding protein